MKRRTKHTQRKTGRRRRSSPSARKFAPPRTVEEFFNMPESVRETLIGVAGAVSKMGADRISLTKASREFGVSPPTVKRLAGSALRKRAMGGMPLRPMIEYSASSSPSRGTRDPWRLQPKIPARPVRQVSTRQQCSAISETGDNSALAKFKGKYLVDANGKRTVLMTDLDDLDRLGSAGELSFESLYARNL